MESCSLSHKSGGSPLKSIKCDTQCLIKVLERRFTLQKARPLAAKFSASPHHTQSIDSQQHVTSCLQSASAAPEGSVFLPPIIPRTVVCRRISHLLSILISFNERAWALAAVPRHTFILIYPANSQVLQVLQ